MNELISTKQESLKRKFSRKKTMSVIMAGVFLLSACGQKGALYIDNTRITKTQETSLHDVEIREENDNIDVIINE